MGEGATASPTAGAVDVVVIDYADLLATDSRDDFRHRENLKWSNLRGLAQIFNCLVVTATQSDANSYSARTITKKHFSEDKRKLAHVTGMIGLNQTESEERDEEMRLNWVVLRRGKRGASVTVQTDFEVCRAHESSKWTKSKKKSGKKEDEESD